jgi:hypothetical protein
MKNLLVLASLLALPLSLVAQSEQAAPTPPPVECSSFLAIPFDGGLDPRIQPDCDSTAFYFGIGRPKDPVAARSCALIERIQHVDKDGSLFTGAGTLSLVYANGEGVPRNLDLARRFVCEIKEAATAETLARLKVIDKIAMTPTAPPKFDLCTNASTGLTYGWCAGIQLRYHDAKRYDQLVAYVDKLTPQQQEAFKTLQAAEAAFEADRLKNEVDQGGLTGWARQLQEEDKIRASFVNDFFLFAKPDYAQPTTFDAVNAMVMKNDTELMTKGTSILRGTTITVDGIKETQDAWVKYRDAWRAFEAAVNPQVSGDAVATQISRERLFHLRRLIEP